MDDERREQVGGDGAAGNYEPPQMIVLGEVEDLTRGLANSLTA